MNSSKLKTIIKKIFIKYNLSKDHASISADALINAELVGAYGHGLSRLKMYCDRISKKVINPKAKIKVKKISHLLRMLTVTIVLVLLQQILLLKPP